MKGIALENSEVGTVSSMKDGSVKFTVYTAELRPSERGVVMEYHGKACAVTIMPHEGTPEETVSVSTERESKTPGQRLRAVLYVAFQHQHKSGETFDQYYSRHIEDYINEVKSTLP